MQLGRSLALLASTASSTVLLVVACLVATEQPAHAYLDPGAGSVAAQVAIAAVAGTVFGLRRWAAGWFARLRGANADATKPRD